MLAKLTGTKPRREMNALEKASVCVEFTVELEKVKSACEWYPISRKALSIRSSNLDFPLSGEMWECSGDCEEESTYSHEWELFEMRQKKLEEKQALMEEQAKYLSDIIYAIETYYVDFVT